MSEPRIVCHFSCGAASAVATKLVLAEFPRERVVIYNAFLKEEHADNRRFLKDCEAWFAHPITVLKDEIYGASVDNVWRTKKFIKSMWGAPCSIELKHAVLDAVCLPNDIHVIGYTADPKDRTRSLRFPDWKFPLIERNLTKNDCLAIVQRAGIELPEMYRRGFNNANCIGCCKGGEGYWNKIRIEFPERFAEVAAIEEEIGENAYLFRNRKTGKRFGLNQLLPTSGRHSEPLPDCSFHCEAAEHELN